MTGLIVFCSLLVAAGLVIGFTAGDWWADRAWRLAFAGDEAEAAADEYISQLRDPEAAGRRAAMARRTHPVYRQRPPEVAHEWEPAHAAAALALASDDPTVSAWTADMAASMDRWLAEHVYGVPYSADELWSGQ